MDFPYEDYPVHFPETLVDLVPLTNEEQEAIRNLNEGVGDIIEIEDAFPKLSAPRHQIGGEPLLLQPDADDSLPCPICPQGVVMEFLASFGDECLDPRGLCGYSHAQVLFHLCRTCHTVTALNRCD